MKTFFPFQADIENGLLCVVADVEGQTRVLCLIDLTGPCHFALDGQSVIYIGEQGRLDVQAPQNTDAAGLLACITYAVSSRESHKQCTKQAARISRRTCFGATALVLVLVAIFAATAWQGTNIKNRAVFAEQDPAPVVKSNNAVQVLQQGTMHTPASPSAVDGTAQVPDAPADGWTLPEVVRAGLPAKLQMAAERKLFTVEYSSGHARTLYVFADPQCPNCQRLEPALEAAAEAFNVVVFPVAVIGRDQSIASITPVLCLPPEQRKAAWSDLFDIGHGVMELGKAQDKPSVDFGNCDIAAKALGVNEVAFQAYRIPGTPWAIADDGRHVSQEVLQSPLKLKAFMGTDEVNHAAK